MGSTKNWQIPKYRVKNRRNADTTFMIGTLYPSRVFVYLKHVCTRNEPQTFRESVGLIGTKIEKPDRLCDHLPLSLRS